MYAVKAELMGANTVTGSVKISVRLMLPVDRARFNAVRLPSAAMMSSNDWEVFCALVTTPQILKVASTIGRQLLN